MSVCLSACLRVAGQWTKRIRAEFEEEKKRRRRRRRRMKEFFFIRMNEREKERKSGLRAHTYTPRIPFASERAYIGSKCEKCKEQQRYAQKHTDDSFGSWYTFFCTTRTLKRMSDHSKSMSACIWCNHFCCDRIFLVPVFVLFFINIEPCCWLQRKRARLMRLTERWSSNGEMLEITRNRALENGNKMLAIEWRITWFCHNWNSWMCVWMNPGLAMTCSLPSFAFRLAHIYIVNYLTT